MSKIPYSKQTIDFSDISAVKKVLKSDFITQGPRVEEFERALASYCGAKYCVAVSNGTAALHLAAMAAGLGPGDEVITTPISFIATSNAALYVGATPVFVDVDYDTVNIDPVDIQKKITKNTKAIFPVDFAGLPADMEAIAAIAKRHRLKVIEDASHALGGSYATSKVGSCEYSDMTVFSFHPVKPITTGEGGAITTNQKDLYLKLKSLRSHGVIRDKAMQKKNGPWYYEMQSLGMNYRITDIQCALGTEQLKRIDQFVNHKNLIAKQYDNHFKRYGEQLRVPAQVNRAMTHAWHLYLLRLKGKNVASLRKKLFDHLVSRDIQPQVHYIPIDRQPYYQKILKRRAHCPQANQYYDEVLSLPIYSSMKSDEVHQVIEAVTEFLEKHRTRAKKSKREGVLAG